MNKKILLLEILFTLAIVLGFKMAGEYKQDQAKTPSREQVYKGRFPLRCAPDWNLLDADSLGMAMKPLPGWGNYRWDIRTSSDSARFYFNQGINMYYAFHIIESQGSFKKAALFDSANAMIYWAQALAYGPNINDFEYLATPDAVAVIKKAQQYAGDLASKDKALIEAMSLRYSLDSTVSRTKLNEIYASAMMNLWKQYPQDADVSALYADARMLQHPWDYWKHNGEAQPWTGEILAVIEKALKIKPGHPGLNHYHIHMCEASPNPGRALNSAKTLETLMPDVSHVVHMPSHIYIRTGKYQTGIDVNDKAVSGYDKYFSLYPDVAKNYPLYIVHNLHLKFACALLMPDFSVALKAAEAVAPVSDTAYFSLPQPFSNLVQYTYMSPLMARVQFEKWDELLKTPEYPENLAFAYCFTKFGKGMAYAQTGNIEQSKIALKLLKEGLKHPDLQVRYTPFNKPADQMAVGERILSGMIAQKENKLNEAVSIFKKAVAAEDSLVYTEPRDWLIPARQYLARAYLLSNNPTAAEKILQEDLVINPHNYHSLVLLKKIYTGKKNRSTDLKKIEKELKEYYKQ